MFGSKLFTRSGLILLLAITVYAALISGHALRISRNEEKKVIAGLDHELLKAARSIPHLIAPDFFDRAVQPGTISEAEDRANIKQLTRIADDLDLSYLYTLVYTNGNVYITSSSASKEERQKQTEVRYFTPYPETAEYVRKAVESGAPVFNTYTDRWGTFRHVYIPLRNKQGLPYILAADHDIGRISGLLKQQTGETVFVSLLFILAGVPFLLAYRLVSKYNARRLKALNLQLTEDIKIRRQAETELVKSEEKFRLLIENSHDIIYTMSTDGILDYVSPAWTVLLGHPADQIEGRPFQPFIHPDDLPACMVWFSKVIKTGQRQAGIEYRVKHIDGTWRWHTSSAVPFTGKDGHVTGYYGIATDITERRNREKELELAKQRLEMTQFALDHASAEALWIDSDGLFVYANINACEKLGYTREELIGLSISEIDPNLPAGTWSAYWENRRKTVSKVFESCHKTKDGRIFPVEIYSNLIRFGDKEYTCTFSHDITERKQMQTALENRIVALTRPLDQSANITVEELFDLAEFQRIQDEFSAATGVTSVISNLDGTDITTSSNSSTLCGQIIRNTEKGCANCNRSNAALRQVVDPKGPITHRCLSAGLWDGCVNIMIGDRHIADWMIGQVRDETHTEEQALQYAREIGADEQTYLEAFRKLPCMSGEHFKQIAQTLFTLANQLSVSAYQNIQQARFIAERQQAEEKLLRLSTAINQTAEAVVVTDAQGIIQYVNPAFEFITGYLQEETAGKSSNLLKSGRHDEAFHRNLWQTITAGQTWTGQLINKRKNGILYIEKASISPVCNPNGAIVNYVAVKRDITNELNKEEQFRQSEKMQAVGQLAGGIAHDFNNILQAILGFSELLLDRLKAETPEYNNVSEIKKAAARAADLTRQLLAFSRKQYSEKKRFNINTVIRDTDVLLHLLLGDKIICVFDLAQNLNPIDADPGQMTQIIMNLAINARDAMPQSGRLTISTENIRLNVRDTAVIPGSDPGEFVCLALTDTGCGMSQEVKDHLFEPFFTTKEPGKGTGLGLSVIYGIVKQHKGWINVYSEEGSGTTVKVYFPAAGSDPARPAGEPPVSGERNGRILLVEDDSDMCNLVARILQDAGYSTFAAATYTEALQTFEGEKSRFDLLFSDIVLPDRNGIELADEIRKKTPALPVLLYSGYRDQRERWSNLESKGYHFLQKPFTITTLLAAVYDALEKASK